METYEQAVAFLFGRINYERLHAAGYTVDDFKLDRMQRLLERLGNPHLRVAAVHVAGTKGKGSTAVMIAEMLTAAGYRTGLFTSPHISRFEERMRIDGAPPSAGELVELTRATAETARALDRGGRAASPTFFELTTALAWLYFARHGADLAVLEVGVGGRLDATNICRPEVTVITSISYDHTRLLGSTLEQIAGEKAGIAKPGIPLVSGVTEDGPRQVIERAAREKQAPLRLLDRDIGYRTHAASSPDLLWLDAADERPFTTIDVDVAGDVWEAVPVPLAGRHQMRNAALAVAAIEELRGRGWPVPLEAARRGMTRVCWPLRIEVVRRRPCVIVDAAHNVASVAALLETLPAETGVGSRVLIFGTTRDKDLPGMLAQLLPAFQTVILTRYVNNPRAVPLDDLQRAVREMSTAPVHVAADPHAAWELAQQLTAPEDLVCATGSFFLAAEVREAVLNDRNHKAEPVGPTTAEPCASITGAP